MIIWAWEGSDTSCVVLDDMLSLLGKTSSWFEDIRNFLPFFFLSLLNIEKFEFAR